MENFSSCQLRTLRSDVVVIRLVHPSKPHSRKVWRARLFNFKLWTTRVPESVGTRPPKPDLNRMICSTTLCDGKWWLGFTL
jgi:hypothetical protein